MAFIKYPFPGNLKLSDEIESKIAELSKEGLAIEKIAEIVGCSPAAVFERVKRIRSIEKEKEDMALAREVRERFNNGENKTSIHKNLKITTERVNRILSNKESYDPDFKLNMDVKRNKNIFTDAEVLSFRERVNVKNESIYTIYDELKGRFPKNGNLLQQLRKVIYGESYKHI